MNRYISISSEGLRTERFCLHSANLLFLMTALIVLLSFANVKQAFGNETELRINQETLWSVPVVLSQSAAIESMDIDIAGYDKTVLEVKDVTLTG